MVAGLDSYMPGTVPEAACLLGQLLRGHTQEGIAMLRCFQRHVVAFCRNSVVDEEKLWSDPAGFFLFSSSKKRLIPLLAH